jgi:competence protein ComEC
MKRFVILIYMLVSFSGYTQEQVMFVHYIDMGQGLATILQFPKGIVMIDAGSQISTGRDESRKKVNDYLETFFDKFPHYNKTIDAIIVTHNHQDHTGTIPDIYANYTIRNLVTTKFNKGVDVKVHGVKKFYVKYRTVLKNFPNGLSNPSIDPLGSHDGVNPKITIYSGENSSFKSKNETANNHSLVIKVEFGKASFIFTGDLEEKGIAFLLDKYKDHLSVLDVDVYQVGHHGSPNATNQELLDALTPQIAVISASHEDDKTGGSGFDHGHPRDTVVSLLAENISRKRSTPITGHVYAAQEVDPDDTEITKAIYCTCWDGNIIIRATSNGSYRVLLNSDPTAKK